MTEDHLIFTWKEIHKLLKNEDGQELMSFHTLVRRYGPELKRTGAVFEWNLGKGKKPVIACFPSQFKVYFAVLQQKRYKEKQENKKS